MKSGFSDPIAVKKQKPQDKPKDGKGSPWDFTCPDYDQRTSSFINAGNKHGVGHRQPEGREGNAKMDAATLPFGRVSTMKVDEAD